MKKMMLMVIGILFTAQFLFAQMQCKCNDKGWQTFVANLKGKTTKVECGYQFTLTCADTIRLKGLYKCLGDCAAKYKAVLKNTATNTVVQNYPSFTFTWTYKFAGPGNYSLEITPICGDKPCQTCRFFFTVKDCKQTCECNPEGWQPAVAVVGTASQTVKCGFQFSLKVGEPIKITEKYVCKGDCNATYVGRLVNVTTGAVVTTYSPFTFPWSYVFKSAGNYKLEITPICGGKRCTPCVYYFTVVN